MCDWTGGVAGKRPRLSLVHRDLTGGEDPSGAKAIGATVSIELTSQEFLQNVWVESIRRNN